MRHFGLHMRVSLLAALCVVLVCGGFNSVTMLTLVCAMLLMESIWPLSGGPRRG